MIAPAPALVLFGILVIIGAVLFWPGRGLVARWRVGRRRSDAELGDDILKRLHHEPRSDSGALRAWLGESGDRVGSAMAKLQQDGLLKAAGAGWSLTPAGLARAAHLVRAHRLWERYLADRTGVPETDWHPLADRKEHQLSPEEVDRLAVAMGRPVVDPHGDPIPGADGGIPALDGWPLAESKLGEQVEVLHLEDEPPEPYRRLVRLGVAPGDRLVPLARDAKGLEIRWNEHHTFLPADEVAAVTVGSAGAPALHGVPLVTLMPGASAQVTGIARSLRGPQRRRLLDLGFVPGTVVEAEFSSALGDPVAYRVRGALIALRREQAAAVLTEPAA